MLRSTTLGTVLVVFCMSLPASTVHALANRVFVSARSGNDANACDSILAPCQTFAGAVTKLNPGGEAIVLDSGGYGPVTITQSLTIEAPPGVVAFIHPPSGDAITVNAGASDNVVLRGLVLNGGSGHGINVNSGGAIYIENCVISGFIANLAGFGADGIRVNASGSKTFVKDTISRHNRWGAAFLNGQATIDHCRFEGNDIDGVLVGGANVTVRDSVSAGNGDNGFEDFANGSPSTVLEVYECVSANNGADGIVVDLSGAGTVTARVANSSINDNVAVGLETSLVAGATIESLGNNFVQGNGLGPISGNVTVVSPH